MRSPKGETPVIELEATIDELAPGGEGVAVAAIGGERRAVFVRGVARGDRVRLAVDDRSRPARGRVLALLQPSPDRVDPACPWAEAVGISPREPVCGGCDWMHLGGEAQRIAHADHVRRALPSEWRDRVPSILAHTPSTPLAYRTRARVHVRASGGRAIVGMHEARTRDPVEVDRCAVLHPDLEAARARLGALLEGAHGRGEVHVALGSLARSPRQAVLEVSWSGPLPAASYRRLEEAAAAGWLAGARVTAGDARVPAKVGDATPWIMGGDGEPLRLAPGGFGQASDAGNAALATRVAEIAAEACGGKRDARVVELYAGSGNFTVLLARMAGVQVVAVESGREACEAARANLAARGLSASARVVEADAGVFAVPPATHLVVLDPPRSGAREVSARLAASSVRHVLYVSCDTQTLARDLAIFEQAGRGFTPRQVEAFELFPQTSHTEVVVHLERRRE